MSPPSMKAGGLSISTGLMALGSYGAIQGAKTANTSTTATMTKPIRPVLLRHSIRSHRGARWRLGPAAAAAARLLLSFFFTQANLLL